MQIGFFNIVGQPLFSAVAELCEDAKPMLEGVQENLKFWESESLAAESQQH